LASVFLPGALAMMQIDDDLSFDFLDAAPPF
jgi:hypothetical protein